jgi:hypothetical protein
MRPISLSLSLDRAGFARCSSLVLTHLGLQASLIQAPAHSRRLGTCQRLHLCAQPSRLLLVIRDGVKEPISNLLLIERQVALEWAVAVGEQRVDLAFGRAHARVMPTVDGGGGIGAGELLRV